MTQISKILGDTLSWARLAKGLGLLAFLLPWMTVSCQGRPLITASGYQMAVGKLQVSNPMTGAAQNMNVETSVQVFLIAAMVVVVAGIALSFWPKAVRRAAPIILAGGLIGAALAGGAMAGAMNSAKKELNKQQGEDQFSAMAAAAFTVHTRYGFWLTLTGLLAGSALAGAAWAGYERVRLPAAVGPSEDRSGS